MSSSRKWSQCPPHLSLPGCFSLKDSSNVSPKIHFPHFSSPNLNAKMAFPSWAKLNPIILPPPNCLPGKEHLSTLGPSGELGQVGKGEAGFLVALNFFFLQDKVSDRR